MMDEVMIDCNVLALWIKENWMTGFVIKFKCKYCEFLPSMSIF